jgi:hypothetical protein
MLFCFKGHMLLESYVVNCNKGSIYVLVVYVFLCINLTILEL